MRCFLQKNLGLRQSWLDLGIWCIWRQSAGPHIDSGKKSDYLKIRLLAVVHNSPQNGKGIAMRTEQEQHAKGVLLPCALQTFQFFHCRKDAEKISTMGTSAR
jgi:hypothetical protein